MAIAMARQDQLASGAAPEAAPLPTRVNPAIWLVYLVFYLIAPIVSGDVTELLRALAVIAVFVPVYFWICRRRGWQVLPGLILIVAFGFYGCRTNLGASNFFIYAAALGVRLGPPRRALGWLALLVPVEIFHMFLVAARTHPSAFYFLLPVLICTVLFGLLGIHQEKLDRNNEELRRSREEVARLAKSAERERIARDLHDLLGHTLSLVVLKSQLAGRLHARGDQRAGAEIAEVERIARQALQEVRTAVAGWRAAGLPEEARAAALACEAAGLDFLALGFDGGDESVAAGLPPLVAEVMAMSLREAVTNVLRHAEARRCRVELATMPGGWRLEIADDGRGLATPASEAGEVGQGGQGLANIRERAERLGGRAEWREAAGGGTVLRLELPRAAAFAAPQDPGEAGRSAA